MMKVALHQVSGPCEQLLATFDAAHETDKWAEGKKRLFFGLGLTGLIAGVVLFFLGLSGESGAVIGVGAVLAVAGIVMFIVRSGYSEYDLDDRKLATVVQFLKIIQADTSPQQPIKVTIDFRDYMTGGEQTANETVDPGLFGSNIRVKKYLHGWFKASGQLADGTRYEVEVADRVGRKEKPKRKYTKVKEKICSMITIKLRLKEDRYGDPQAVAAALRELQPPPGMAVKSIAPQGQSLALVLACDTTITVKGRYGTDMPQPGLEVTGNEVLQAMLWAYDGIARGAPSRAA